MMCLSLDTYRGYFDIDADDIVTRIKSVCLDFYKPEHFRNNVLGQKMNGMKGPDLYGPFWITMTLVFFIGVSCRARLSKFFLVSAHEYLVFLFAGNFQHACLPKAR